MIHKAHGLYFGPAHDLGVPSESIRHFYASNWPRPVALAVPSFYRWQFLQPPDHHGHDLNCVAITSNGEILGVMGLNRRPFWLGQRLVTEGAELTTWVVAERARGQGIGRGIMTSLQSTYEQLAGFGISHAAMSIYVASGFRQIRQIPRYFCILDLEAVRPYAKIDPIGERFVKSWNRSTAVPLRVTEVEPSELALHEESMRKRFNFYIRNAKHLVWRYRDHPVFRYECYIVRGTGRAAAGIVLRTDETAGIRFMHVVDCFGDDKAIPLAVSFVEQTARARGAAFIDIYCTASAIAGHFLAAGWLSTNDDYFFQLSHLFYPPEFRPVQTTSAVIWSREQMSQLVDLGRLYLSKGDLDLDRPTLAYYERHGIPTH